jgi:hypothetical protein
MKIKVDAIQIELSAYQINSPDVFKPYKSALKLDAVFNLSLCPY